MSDFCAQDQCVADGSTPKSELGEEQIELAIRGMTCDACASHVASALQSVDGVVAAEVPDWKSGRALVTVTSPDRVPEETLIRAVSGAGYQASRNSSHAASTTKHPGPAQSQDEWGQGADYDLVVIGTGGGGMAAAIRAAEMDRSVCIIERGTIGGTCVNIGCVPSKTLIRAAESYYKAGHQPFRGVHTKAEGLDWRVVIAQKDELVGGLRQTKYVDVLSSYAGRITVMHGRARLLPNGVIALDDGRTCKARKIVIATGARPSIPPLDGAQDIEVLTSTSAMELREQPRSLIVVGGRFIALELGQTFARFGTKVTILQGGVKSFV